MLSPTETSHVMLPVGERNVRTEADADAGAARARATAINPRSFHAGRFVAMSVSGDCDRGIDSIGWASVRGNVARAAELVAR